MRRWEIKEGWRVQSWLLATLLLALPLRASAELDYDPESEEWNGLDSFADQARSLGLQLDIRRELDYATIDADTSLIIVYPTVPLDEGALVSHLRRGGRMLVADDFGMSGDFLERLGVRRDERPVVGGLHFRDRPNLPIAAPVAEDHVLTVDVRRLMTNHPTTLESDLPPVFVTGSPPRTLVAVGAIGDGRLVILGDPSVLINNMLEVRSNQQFARNVLTYLGGMDNSRRLVLVAGRFGQRNGGDAIATSAGEARRNLNIQMGRMNDWFVSLAALEPPFWLSLVASMITALLVFFVVLKLEPKAKLYSGKWLQPMGEERSAGFVGTLEYLKNPKASHIYPLMILKRVLEERLLEGLELEAPARLGEVMEAYARVEPNPGARKELEKLLLRLSTFAGTTTDGEGGPRVSARDVRRTFDLARKLLRPVGRDIEVP